MSKEIEDLFLHLWAEKDKPKRIEPTPRPEWLDEFTIRGLDGYWDRVIASYNGQITYMGLSRMLQGSKHSTTANTVRTWVRGGVPQKKLSDRTVAALTQLNEILKVADRVRLHAASKAKQETNHGRRREVNSGGSEG